jgi:hypothetical protein
MQSLHRRSGQCCSSPSPGRFVVEPDPSLRSTPEIRVCERCGTETRWRRRTAGLEFIDVAPPAHLFRFRPPIHSHIVQANRARATWHLPTPVRLAIGCRA